MCPECVSRCQALLKRIKDTFETHLVVSEHGKESFCRCFVTADLNGIKFTEQKTINEGGIRGLQVQNQITFQRGDEEPVVKRFEEVYVDAAVLEANAANSVDMINRYAHSVGDAREERE